MDDAQTTAVDLTSRERFVLCRALAIALQVEGDRGPERSTSRDVRGLLALYRRMLPDETDQQTFSLLARHLFEAAPTDKALLRALARRAVDDLPEP